MIEKFESKSFQFKRMAAAHGIKAFWPFELREQNPGNVALLDDVLKEGHGAIGLVPHFSKGDFLTIISSLALNNKELIKRPILIPIAAHQRPVYLEWLCDFGNISLATIITGDTRRKERQLIEKGRCIPWQELDPGTAMNQYLDRAAEMLKLGGIVILAPQGGRRSLLTPFKGGPIARLEERTTQTGVNKLAFFSIGLEIPGASDYSKFHGLNLRSKYVVTLGATTKRADIKGNIDDWGYQDMLKLAPPAYRPQKAA